MCEDVAKGVLAGLGLLTVFGLGYVFGRLDALAKAWRRAKGGERGR